jgi:hypothetical protein
MAFSGFPAAIPFGDDCPLASGLAMWPAKKTAGDAIGGQKKKRQV